MIKIKYFIRYPSKVIKYLKKRENIKHVVLSFKTEFKRFQNNTSCFILKIFICR